MGKGLRLFPHAVTLLSFLEKLVNVDSTDIVIGYVRVSCGVDGAISSPSVLPWSSPSMRQWGLSGLCISGGMLKTLDQKR